MTKKADDFKVGDAVYYDGNDDCVLLGSGFGTVSGFYGDGSVRVYLYTGEAHQDIMPQYLINAEV